MTLKQFTRQYKNRESNKEYIRHRAARHARACSIHCLLSDCLVFFVFKGAHTPGDGFTCLTCAPIFEHFSHHFFRPVFYHNWCQKVPNWEPQKSTKSYKSRKTHHQNALLIEACKKTPSRRGQTSEFDDGYTLSAVFSGAQGSEKGVGMEPQWNLRAPQISKNQKKWALKKTPKNNTAKSGLLVENDLKRGRFFRAGNVSKITKIQDIFKMGSQASKMSPRVPEITQNHESDHPKSRKSWKKESRKS